MQTVWDWILSDKMQMSLAGALGGAVRWMSLREDLKSGIISILVGCICSVYLSPLAMPVLEPFLGNVVIDESARAGFSGFIIGVGGIAVAGFVIDVWKTKRSAVNGGSSHERDNG